MCHHAQAAVSTINHCLKQKGALVYIKMCIIRKWRSSELSQNKLLTRTIPPPAPGILAREGPHYIHWQHMGLALSELHDAQKACSVCHLVSVLFIKLLFTCYKISITVYHSIPFSTFTGLTNQSPLSNSIEVLLSFPTENP